MLTTQRDSYLRLLEDLNERQIVVYAAICDHPATLFHLEARLGWKINCISGRVTELHEKGLIKTTTTVKNPVTGRAGALWEKDTKDGKQPDLFAVEGAL